ncbi:VWA domain-containing protein [Mesonia sp. K7]|uniref:vWA domain-containing protein n=1 Tax=Mesonia sp. K7 TaxID=2218606 RepID=UPI000DA787A2|nr:VWA domain-containing protein [Mesonia sp. K7]PZD79033.1 BatB protein [Mesonia sp. K7]
MIFEQKIYFWLFVIIPILVLLFLGYLLWRKKAHQKFASAKFLKILSPNLSTFKVVLKFIVFLLALCFFILALVNPQIGSKLETVKREGVDIVFAVDVSKSMLAEDIAPNRLEKSKQIVTQILNNLAGDRVGIIAYAGSAFPQLPITTDYSSAKLFLQALNTDMVSSQGTAINDAIELATTYYDDETKTSRILVILSDGEDHSGDIEAISEKAAEVGIKIFTVGVGTEKGGTIPIKRNGRVIEFKKDQNNQTVITKLDQEVLTAIAEETDGSYIDGTNTSKVVEEINTLLQDVEKTEFEAKQFADYKSQFQWFLGLGILFLVFEILLLERKTSWITQLNLFNEKKENEVTENK